jgi:hypothetical protein
MMAMRRSVASAEVQVAGCHALAYACCNNPEGDFHACVACCSAAADADAHAAVVSALAAHPRDAKLNTLAVRALREMLRNNELLARRAATADGSAVPLTITSAMQRSLSNVELVQYGSEALSIMYRLVPNATPPPGLALLMVSVLRQHSSIDDVCANCMMVLTHLIASDVSAHTKRSVLDAGLPVVAVHALCQHVRGGQARLAAAEMLFIVAVDDTLIQRQAVACGVLKLLRKIMDAGTNHGGPIPGVEQAFFKGFKNLLAARAEAHDEACTEPGCELCGMQSGRCAAAGCSLRAGASGDVILKRCASCRTAAYCCSAHQRNAWATHKPACHTRAAVLAALATLADETATG